MTLDINMILNIATLILIFLFGLIIKNFLPKYFNEKGKNLATKEDIGEITKIVENIKFNLLKDIEILKAQLAITNQNKFNISSAFREALFDYNKKYSAWLYSIVRFSFSNYNEENLVELNNYVQNLSSRLYDFDLSDAHLRLFFSEEKYSNLNHNLVVSTLKLESKLQLTIIEMKHLLNKFLRDKDSNPERLNVIRNKLFQDILNLQTEYNEEFEALYAITHKEHAKISKYIQSVVETSATTKS
jgi:hypothetical protein